MTSGHLSLDHAGAGVALLTIDRPPVNALAPADWRRLAELVRGADADTDVRALVITGTADAFCAGADVRTLVGGAFAGDATTALAVVAEAAGAIRSARMPVVAGIDGPARGGGLELALACDVRVAAGSATFAAAGVNMGLIASVGSLIAAIGDTRARWMLLTGASIDSGTALEWGLVVDNPEPDAPLAAEGAVTVAAEIAGRAPLAVEATKAAATAYHRLTDAEHARLLEELFVQLAGTEDHEEALAAFLEKREPRYSRR